VRQLEVEIEPGEVGLDGGRFHRIAAHFGALVDKGELPGWAVVVGRHGKVVYLETQGYQDVGTGAPIRLDTLFRLASMTKPVTAVAAMVCMERGLFDLRTPVSEFVPAFAKAQIYKGGPADAPETEAAREPVRVWHLLSHTSGLVSSWLGDSAPYELAKRADERLAGCAGPAEWASCYAEAPLLFEPGTSWHYSVASDVLGWVVELASGQPLDAFCREEIFGPLQMPDSCWHVEPSEVGRLALVHERDEGTQALGALPPDKVLSPPARLEGGSDLISTLGDYYRFAEFLRHRGELDGARVLSPRTVDFMTVNHLPGGTDIAHFGTGLLGDPLPGLGYGLGVGVWVDPVAAEVPWSAGSYFWPGGFNTCFWVDPVLDITVVFMTHLLRPELHRFRDPLVVLVNQSAMA
jgi:CubicO group peptidase (beta-lactamase class C family)